MQTLQLESLEPSRTRPTVEIRSLQIGDDATAFRTLNEEWITRFFALEPKDIEILHNPDNNILRKGGRIFLAYADAIPVGCVALIPKHNEAGERTGVYELSKMAVSPHLRGLGIGRKLLEHTIAEARLLGARSLFLGSSTKLPSAVHLYESVGFRHVPPEQLPPNPYARADVFMDLQLAPQPAEHKLEQTMTLRPGTHADIPAIMQIIRAVVPLMRASGNLQWDDIYPNPEAFALDVDLNRLSVVEITRDNATHIAGVVALTTEQDPEYVEAGWDITIPAIVVHRLAVHPDFKGQGIARTLMLQAEVAARTQRIAEIRVDTNTQNLAMQKILLQLNYRYAGEISLAFRPGLRFACFDKHVELT